MAKQTAPTDETEAAPEATPEPAQDPGTPEATPEQPAAYIATTRIVHGHDVDGKPAETVIEAGQPFPFTEDAQVVASLLKVGAISQTG